MATDSRGNRGLRALTGGLTESWQTSRSNFELWANLLVIVVAAGFMIWRGVGFAITLGTVVAIWAILAVSLNLLVGYTGLLSVGHVGFFGIGAYTMAILTSDPAYEQLRTEALPIFAWPFFAVLPICMALAGLVAIVIGVVFNRFRDDIFVLVSFGFAVIAFNVFLNWEGLTRGAFGIHQIARPAIGSWELDGEMEFLLLVVLFLVWWCWPAGSSSLLLLDACLRPFARTKRRSRSSVTGWSTTNWRSG